MSMTLNCDICGQEMNQGISTERSELVEIKAKDGSTLTFGVNAKIEFHFNTSNRHWCKQCLDIIVQQAFVPQKG